MSGVEVFTLAADVASARTAADALFDRIAADLRSALPASAEVLHVGATSVPGCLTKGDLDIAVRVDRADFARAEAILAQRFRRNTGSARTQEFAAFEDAGRAPHLGVQLTVKDGALDHFHHFADALRADAQMLRRYNDLKRSFANAPMDAYRQAKSDFIESVLRKHLGNSLG